MEIRGINTSFETVHIICFSIFNGKCILFSTRLRSMAVTTCLTWMQEKILQNHFGGKFNLLYKASVHKFSLEHLLQVCSNQGPTVTVIYSKDHVTGAFMQEGYQEGKTSFITLFALQETKILECKMKLCVPSMLFVTWTGWHRQKKYEFGIDLTGRKLHISANTSKELGLLQCESISFEECEVFQCEGRFNQTGLCYRVLACMFGGLKLTHL